MVGVFHLRLDHPVEDAGRGSVQREIIQPTFAFEWGAKKKDEGERLFQARVAALVVSVSGPDSTLAPSMSKGWRLTVCGTKRPVFIPVGDGQTQTFYALDSELGSEEVLAAMARQLYPTALT